MRSHATTATASHRVGRLTAATGIAFTLVPAADVEADRLLLGLTTRKGAQ